MTKNYYLSLLMFFSIGFSLNAQNLIDNLTDNPANYQQTTPMAQQSEVFTLPETNAYFGKVDSTISTIICDSGSVTLVGTGEVSSVWSSDSSGVNVITATDTFTSGVLTGDTAFYHTSISDSTIGSPTLGAQTGTYSTNVRGYTFVAPVDMIITGFWVPTDANSGVQHVEILRFGTAVPIYPSVTNNFTF